MAANKLRHQRIGGQVHRALRTARNHHGIKQPVHISFQKGIREHADIVVTVQLQPVVTGKQGDVQFCAMQHIDHHNCFRFFESGS